jgi:hypothetical protein
MYETLLKSLKIKFERKNNKNSSKKINQGLFIDCVTLYKFNFFEN